MKVKPNMYAKLEGFNVGGSIKDRAVMKVTMGMFERGELKSGDTIAVCTSGNAGRSLLFVQDQLKKKGIDLHVKIFMPKRYLTRDSPTMIAETRDVETIKGDQPSSFYIRDPTDTTLDRSLNGLDGEFMEVQEKMVKLAKEHGWSILDQHYDINSLEAHKGTAEEILAQLPNVTDVVCTTGTGGTASGLRKYLPDHVRIHARPAKPGSMDGITDVRRYTNFCDSGLLIGYTNGYFDPSIATEHQEELSAMHNITAGQSSGATFALAKEIVAERPDAQVVFICACGTSSDITWKN
jgi:cysteine synthase A